MTARTLPQLLLEHAARTPDARRAAAQAQGDLAPVHLGRGAANVQDIAFGLDALGVRGGDSVIVVGENEPENLWAELAAQLVGAKSCPSTRTSRPPRSSTSAATPTRGCSSRRTRSRSTRPRPARRHRDGDRRTGTTRGCGATPTRASCRSTTSQRAGRRPTPSGVPRSSPPRAGRRRDDRVPLLHLGDHREAEGRGPHARVPDRQRGAPALRDVVRAGRRVPVVHPAGLGDRAVLRRHPRARGPARRELPRAAGAGPDEHARARGPDGHVRAAPVGEPREQRPGADARRGRGGASAWSAGASPPRSRRPSRASRRAPRARRPRAPVDGGVGGAARRSATSSGSRACGSRSAAGRPWRPTCSGSSTRSACRCATSTAATEFGLLAGALRATAHDLETVGALAAGRTPSSVRRWSASSPRTGELPVRGGTGFAGYWNRADKHRGAHDGRLVPHRRRRVDGRRASSCSSTG